MPRFFFMVRDGSVIRDPCGLDLPDTAAARREALDMAAQLLTQPGDRFWTGAVWHIDVSEGDGPVLFSVAFSARTEQPHT